MHKLFAVVLLYNTKIEDSITCKKIEEANCENLKIIIIDNSTIELNNEEACKLKNYQYLSMNGNKGLSIPYNKAIDYIINIEKADENDYVIWLDDDTEITKEYFDKLEEAIETNPNVDIFAPIIYGQDGVIYSPNNARYIKNKLVSNEDEVDNITKYNAINSCLCVKIKIYNNYRYDETLFLDQTDQNFFDDMRERKVSFYTIKTIIHQNFSQRGDNLDPKKMLVRYEIRTKDIMRYGRKKIINSFKSLIKACGLALQMGLKCKYPKITIKCSIIAIKMFFINIKNIILKKNY